MNPFEPNPGPQSLRNELVPTLLDCYLGAIVAISACLDGLAPDLATPHRDRLLKIRNRLAFDSTVPALIESKQALAAELSEIGEKAAEAREVRSEDLRQILVLLAQAEDTFTIRRDGYTDQFRHFSREMDEAASAGDSNEAREKLKAQLSELRSFVETVYSENNQVFARMQTQVEEFRTRLRLAEANAARDPLTGIANRRELDRQLQARLESSKPFCLLVFDLDGFKSINDRFGHLCGDEILKQAGAALCCQVRARDFVCRWGGDEFLVILECGLEQARPRSQQIAQWLSGHYRVEAGGRESVVEVKISVGVAERREDDTIHSLFQRADELLLQGKAGKKLTLLTRTAGEPSDG